LENFSDFQALINYFRTYNDEQETITRGQEPS